MSKARGSLYRQAKSPYWWASYYINGKQVRLSTKLENKKAAQQFLAQKVAANTAPDKRSVSVLLDGLIACDDLTLRVTNKSKDDYPFGPRNWPWRFKYEFEVVDLLRTGSSPTFLPHKHI